MGNNYKFKITNHAVDRFKERLRNKFSDVDFTSHNCMIRKIREVLNKAEENKSFLNNTSFVMKLYDKYGYDRIFKYLCYEGIAFVVIKDNGNWVVATCFPMDDRNESLQKHIKYKKKCKLPEENISEYMEAINS